MIEGDSPDVQDEEEADALAKFLEEIRASRNCVKCFNIVLLLLGVGLTVFSFVGGELLLSLNWLAFALSGLGIAIVFTTLLGVVGSCFNVFRGILMLVSFSLWPLPQAVETGVGSHERTIFAALAYVPIRLFAGLDNKPNQ